MRLFFKSLIFHFIGTLKEKKIIITIIMRCLTKFSFCPIKMVLLSDICPFKKKNIFAAGWG